MPSNEKPDAASAKTGQRSRFRVVAGGGNGESERSTLLGLSVRETQVARLAVRGLTEVAIAHALTISKWTVRTHVRRSYRKLGVSSRVELAALVYEAEARQDARHP
jgi:DNA-binding CsgD family transcriptional regulator